MIFGRIWRPGDRPFPALLKLSMKSYVLKNFHV